MKEVERRYSLSPASDPGTEVVLLKGRGCFWRKCAFCDYYEDRADEESCNVINEEVLRHVTGEDGRLTVINSGSWFELPKKSQELIFKTLQEKGIGELSTEAHWAYRDRLPALREALERIGVRASFRIGIETFDEHLREDLFKKGMGRGITVEEIADTYDECCLLFGVKGQSIEMLLKDLEIATRNFKRVYLNLYMPNEKLLPADEALLQTFRTEIEPMLKNEKRPGLIILSENTDLDVG